MNAKKVLNNTKWIVICKIIQSILQLIIGMLCARYLGPSNYGLINYAASIVSFALPIMKLGFDSTLVRELVNDPEHEGEIMGTSLAMNIVSSFACMCGVSAFAALTNMGETTTILVCILYSISLLFSALEMVQYWFQYKLLSKYSSVVMLVSYIIASSYRIFLLVSGKSVLWFALTNSLDFGIIGICLIILYLRQGTQKFSFSFERAKEMFARSKHYIIASLMIVVIQNTDHIMLTTMISEQENGYYSAAITCTTIAQFVYLAIIDSFRPVILANKKESQEKYEKNLSALYSITIHMALAQGVVFTLFAPLIVNILYGADYAPTIRILQILIWYFAFSVMGVVRNVWILAEEKQKYLWQINLFGALANVSLNLIMIPLWGACGAALASLLTQFFTNFVLGFILKPVRENNKLLLRGCNLVFLIKEARSIIKIIRKK